MYTQTSDISPQFLFDYVLKNKRTVLFWITVCMCVLVFGNKFIFPDKYTAHALVQIQHNTFKTRDYNSISRARMVREEILSTSILSRVIKHLKMDKPSEFTALDVVFQLFNLNVKRKPVNRDALMRDITSQISIDEVQANTQQLFFTVSATSNEAEASSALVNAIVNEYIKVKTENKIKETGATSEFLTNHLVTLEEKTLIAEQKLTEFKLLNARHLMSPIMMMTAKTTNKRDRFKLSSKVNELQARLVNVNSALLSTPKFNTAGNTNPTDPTPAALNQMTASQQLSYKKNMMFNMQQRYTSNHPTIKKLIRDIKMLEKNVGNQVVTTNEPVLITSGINQAWLSLSREKSTIEAELATSILQLSVLGEELDELNMTLEESPQVVEQMNNIESKVRALTKERDDIRLKQIQANIDAKSANTYAGNDYRIVDHAQAPTLSNVASRGIMYTGSIFVSILIGIVIIIAKGFTKNFVLEDIKLKEYNGVNRFARKFNYVAAYVAIAGFISYELVMNSLIIT